MSGYSGYYSYDDFMARRGYEVHKLPPYFANIDDESLYSTAEVSELVGVGSSTVRTWCRRGLPANGAGHYKINGLELKRYLFRTLKRFKNK